MAADPVPGAGFEPARSREQRFLRPPAYANSATRARTSSYGARPDGAGPVSARRALQAALEGGVGRARRAVGLDEAGIEAVAAVAEPVVAVEALDVLVVLLDHREHVLRAVGLTGLVAFELAELRDPAGLGVPELRDLVALADGLDDPRRARVAVARVLLGDAAVDLGVGVDPDDLRPSAP